MLRPPGVDRCAHRCQTVALRSESGQARTRQLLRLTLWHQLTFMNFMADGLFFVRRGQRSTSRVPLQSSAGCWPTICFAHTIAFSSVSQTNVRELSQRPLIFDPGCKVDTVPIFEGAQVAAEINGRKDPVRSLVQR